MTTVFPGAGGTAEGLAPARGLAGGRQGGIIPQAGLWHGQAERALHPSLPSGRGGNSVRPGKEAGGCKGCCARKIKAGERTGGCVGCVCVKTIYLLSLSSIRCRWYECSFSPPLSVHCVGIAFVSIFPLLLLLL